MKKTPLRISNETLGKRLALFIKHTGLSMTKFGERVGATRGEIKHYIRGNAALPNYIFTKLYFRFMVSARWLATGKGSMEDRFLILNRQVFENIPLEDRFQETYSSVLSPIYEAYEANAAARSAMALETIKLFVSSAEKGQQLPTAIVAVADEAVRHWIMDPRHEVRSPHVADAILKRNSVSSVPSPTLQS